MVSPETLRRYPFFGGLGQDRLVALCRIAKDVSVEEGHTFFREEETMDAFYLLLEGAVSIVFEMPERDAKHKISEQFLRDMQTEDLIVSTVGSGDVFGWSGLIPPHTATAGAKALTACKVVAFPSHEITALFEDDRELGMALTVKAAQLIRKRLRDVRIESLAYMLE